LVVQKALATSITLCNSGWQMEGLVICASASFSIKKIMQHIPKCLQHGPSFMQVMFAFSIWCGWSTICNVAGIIFCVAIFVQPNGLFFSPLTCVQFKPDDALFSCCQFLIKRKHVVRFRIRHAVYHNQLWILDFDLNSFSTV